MINLGFFLKFFRERGPWFSLHRALQTESRFFRGKIVVGVRHDTPVSAGFFLLTTAATVVGCERTLLGAGRRLRRSRSLVTQPAFQALYIRPRLFARRAIYSATGHRNATAPVRT